MSKIYDALSSMIMKATKERDTQRSQAYKNLKAKLIEWKTSKEGSKVLQETFGEIPEATEISIIQKMVAELSKDIESYGTREDLVAEARAEMEVLSELLPAEPGPEEIKEVIDSWPGPFEKKSMGQIVKYVKEKLPGAPGKKVSELVKEYLA